MAATNQPESDPAGGGPATPDEARRVGPPADWGDRVQAVFDDMVGTAPPPPGEPDLRAERLRALCGGDDRLVSEVSALLSALDRANGGAWLESPPTVTAELAEAALRELSAASHGAPAPVRVGRFHVRRLIGAGGMGAVYEAVQEQPHRVVAVKVMRHGAASQRAMHRFQHEAQLLARLRHPNIAQVLEAGVHQDVPVRSAESAGSTDHVARVPFIAMELVENGVPITRYAEQHGLDTPARLRLFASVCDAVHHANEHGIIHLDLKPSNILVGSDGQPRVIDFGVAHAIDPETTITATLTGPAPLVGTLQYMSPEQVRLGDKPEVDRRSDVYSLGLVLYELLCRRLPYDLSSVTIPEATRRIQEMAPEPPGRVVAGVPGDLETVVLTALRKEPAARYQTAADLRDDILAVLEGRAIRARPQTGADKLRRGTGRWVARRPVLTAILTVLAAAFLASLLGDWIIRRWMAPDLAFERFIGVNAAPTAAPPMDGVRLIHLKETPTVEEIAERAGLEGVTTGERSSNRRLHGRLLERLAECDVAAVLLDLSFQGASRFDQDLVRGIRALRVRNKHTIAAFAADWLEEPPERISDSPAIRSEVRLGSATVMAHSPERIDVDLAVRRVHGTTVPSVALAAWAAARHPEAEPLYRIHEPTNEIEIEYIVLRSTDRMIQRLEQVDRLVVSVVEAEPPLEPNEDAQTDRFGLQPGDVVASLFLDMPASQAAAAVTTNYADALTMPLEDLRRLVNGRVVVVGDARLIADDFMDEARTLSGSVGMAVCVAALQSNRFTRMPSAAGGWGANLLAAATGTAIGTVGGRRRTGARWVPISAGFLVAVALLLVTCFYATRASGSVYAPFHPMLALGLGGALALAAATAERGHRLDWATGPFP